MFSWTIQAAIRAFPRTKLTWRTFRGYSSSSSSTILHIAQLPKAVPVPDLKDALSIALSGFGTITRLTMSTQSNGRSMGWARAVAADEETAKAIVAAAQEGLVLPVSGDPEATETKVEVRYFEVHPPSTCVRYYGKIDVKTVEALLKAKGFEVAEALPIRGEIRRSAPVGGMFNVSDIPTAERIYAILEELKVDGENLDVSYGIPVAQRLARKWKLDVATS